MVRASQIIAAIAISMASIAIVPSTALAQTGAASTQSADRKFSPESGALVTEATDYAAEGNYKKAIKRLKKARDISSLKPYEIGVIEQMLGNYYYKQNKNDDAIDHFERALASGGLLAADQYKLNKSAAQIMIADGQYNDGANRLATILSGADRSSPKYTKMIMQAYIQGKNYPAALPWAENWFGQLQNRERKHYDTMRFLYQKQGQDANQLALLETMTQLWPGEKALWNARMSLLVKLGRKSEVVGVYEAMYMRGLLTSEAELLKLVDFQAFYKNYSAAINLLDREVAAGRIHNSATIADKRENIQAHAALNARP
ncbi:MAG: tetratricopeptide repeat protein [Hellea sp.]|nr:tetratricopeptide repeat protein [Hellea sp.]